jgi:hypothetical protein
MVAVDLVRAQAWRMSWLANAVALLSRLQPSFGRLRPASVIAERVVEGFEPEARVARVQFACRIDSSTSGVTIDETVGATAMTAAVLIMLSTLETVDQPSLQIELTATEGRALVIEIEQTKGAARASDIRDVLNQTTGSLTTRMAAHCLTAWHQGKAEVRAKDGRTVLRCTLQVTA